MSPQKSRPFVMAAVMAAMVMVAVEATIVSTAMPQIVADLGGLRLYSWVFSSFLLAQTATTVVFGKLADIYGRKPVMLLGIAFFLAGSALAGFVGSMPLMIVSRLIQGIGAGAVQPVGLTIVADLYPARERGKVQGYLASVWAVSAVLGPIVGSLIIQHASWAWIFWINIPVGLAAAAGFLGFMNESVTRQDLPIDVAGAVFFSVAVSALLIGLTTIGTSETGALIAASAAFGLASLLFVVQERRTADPMMAFALWSRRPIAACNLAAGLASMALMGLTTFLPMYVQGVLHRSPVVAGLALTMMLVGWPVGATLAARSFQRIGLRPILVGGSVFIPLGATAFLLLTPQSPPGLAAVGSLVMGFGMGLISVGSLVLIQEIVDWSQRAGVTASNIFARNLGSTLGATALGAVLDYGLSHARGGAAVSSDQLRRLLDAGGDHALHGDLEMTLHQALHATFCAMFAISAAVVVMALLVPKAAISQFVSRMAAGSP